MVMASRFEWLRLHGEIARHAQMHPEPAAAAELKEHLLPVRVGAQELGADDPLFQRAHIASAKDTLLRVELDAKHGLVPSSIPLPGVVEDLGEFRHK
jgi:hypothetical protein